MGKERVPLFRNVGTDKEPIWEIWFAKTVVDAVMMSDADNENKTIVDYVNEKIAELIGGAPETYDTLKEIADYIASHKSVETALNAAIGNKADKTPASTNAAGLMSAADKQKLDGVATGANKYIHPTHKAADAGLYKVTVDASGHVTAVTEVTKQDILNLGIAGSDTTYTEATQTKSGLMSKEDKKKLDGLPTITFGEMYPTNAPNGSIFGLISKS